MTIPKGFHCFFCYDPSTGKNCICMANGKSESHSKTLMSNHGYIPKYAIRNEYYLNRNCEGYSVYMIGYKGV